jgi:transcriptional regulator with PAS, ATPase and Fis domain
MVSIQIVRILVIAPYKGLGELFQFMVQGREDIRLTVKVGNLDYLDKLIEEIIPLNYDVVISRGGTSKRIRKIMELPVVDIPISVYDVLRVIKMAETHKEKFAITGFAPITECAKILCDLLQYRIDIITYNFDNPSEVRPGIEQLKRDGYELIIGDMMGTTIARQLGMNSILITSGEESVRWALNEAIQLMSSFWHVQKQKALFQALLKNGKDDFLIYNSDGSLWYSSSPVAEFPKPLLSIIKKELSLFLKRKPQKLEWHLEHTIYSIDTSHLTYENECYVIVHIKKRPALFNAENKSISIFRKREEPIDTSEYVHDTIFAGTVRATIEQYCKTQDPVLILGETGTGKDKSASLIYENGPMRDNPFYSINCALLNEKQFVSLLANDNSPLNTIRTTLYLKNIHALSKTQFIRLSRYFEHSDLRKRNHLIFSVSLDTDPICDISTITNLLKNSLSCLTLYLPPLREHINDIPAIVALYINYLNMELGKQIIGFDAESLMLLKEYSWPYNINQLCRVIKELAITTEIPYITAAKVESVLKKEKLLTVKDGLLASRGSIPFDLNRTLYEINYDIICTVLADEKMNHSKAALRLGIGRNTLWRILKAHQL